MIFMQILIGVLGAAFFGSGLALVEIADQWEMALLILAGAAAMTWSVGAS